MSYSIAIDASRNRSGGAKAHIIGIINALNGELPLDVKEIHIWSYPKLLEKLPSYPWLIKHTNHDITSGLLSQIIWQNRKFPKELKKHNIDILLNTDAGTLCRFKPAVTMSRDMLSYEPGEMERYGISFQRLRLLVLKYVQNYSLRNSAGTIFLTKYAADVIQKSCGNLRNFTIINHGISENFRANIKDFRRNKDIIRCIYISNVAPYKHQIQVAKAIFYLRKQKIPNITISFVGGGEGKAQSDFLSFITEVDPQGEFMNQKEFINHNNLPEIISNADIFIFASSCENMPNTLIEGMCSGLPIACSNRGPMPEMLKDGGVYFNPENYKDVAGAIERLIIDNNLRNELVQKSFKYSKNFSWSKCSKETFDFLIKTIKRVQNEK